MAKLPVEDSDDFASFLLKDFNDKGETTMVALAMDFMPQKVLEKTKSGLPMF